MLKLEPMIGTLGARATGIDLSKPLSDAQFADVLRALARFSVVCFPEQPIDAAQLRRFSARFGTLQASAANVPGEHGMPEVSILSNIVENGHAIGIPDAGQAWHTDMTYNRVVGFVNVLVGVRVPMRDGKVLGATQFANTQAAYEDLPAGVKSRFADVTATHDWNNFHELMRAKGSKRPALTAEQRSRRPPVSHPLFLTHPLTGRKVIYANPGFTVRIDGLDADESRRTLDDLFAHVLQPKYRYVHEWSVGDVVVWEHIGTWHYAVPDYGPDEHRLMKRCQVLADRVFDPRYVRAAMAGSAPVAG